MRKTKLFSLALLTVAWFGSGSAQAQPWDEPAQVDGVYQIGTASELEWFAEYVNSANADESSMLTAKAVLTADIDMTGISHTPIGPNTTYKYDGEFDGQHHVISNMIIDLPDQENVGLFGLVRGNAVIKNIIIDSSCSIKGKNRVAAIIGCNQTVADKKLAVLNCVNMAPVHAYSGVAAGIIGAGQSQYPYFKLHNCVNTGAITTDATNNWTVAFHGWNNSAGGNAEVWSCYNVGTLSRIDNGNNLFRGVNRSVLNSYDLVNTASNMQSQTNIPSEIINNGFQTADPLHSGELCYYLNHGIELMGRGEVTMGEEFTQDLSDPNSIPMPNAAGPKVYQVAAYNCDGTPKGGVSYSNEESGKVIPPHTYSDETGLCTYCGAPNEAFMTPEEDGFYHLSTAAQVEWFSHMVKIGHGAMKVKLDADIDFGGVADAHMPIGTDAKKYFGHFDGQGHRIKGMVLTTANNLKNRINDGQGFFGSVRGGGTDANGTTNNEVIIENLIIDESCSVTHDQNFVAGVVGRVNAVNTGATVIIRNCGNEADVTTSGKNAAGILGCVASTNVGLKLYNLWNKGTIVGNGGESAAICAWTGQRNVDGEVDVEGCWNIGEVTGIDGNHYNMIRRNTNIVPRNIVDLCIANGTKGGNQGTVSVWNSENPISSGELCYLLNGDQTSIVYTQTLGTDAMPVYGTTSKQVYQAGTINCAGVAVGDLNYNNESGKTVQLGHNINDEIGMCDVCYTQFQEPAKDGDYYLLKNAGNVEWLSAEVAAGGGKAFYAKMTNDIDFLGRENLHSPIGPSTGSKFKGVFDGQGYRVKNMVINRPTTPNQGFFGWLQGNDNTTIKNLIIDKSCSIIGSNKCGGVAGASQNASETAKITIENVVNEADVTVSGQDVAGIVGGEQDGKATYYIHNVVNTGNITSTHKDPYAGALFCYQEKGSVENFLNLGTITGHKGGNIGRFNVTWTNVIDLSNTEDKTQGVVEGLTAEDVVNGKVAYIMGFKQLIGTDEYPSPLNNAEVSYVGEAEWATIYDASTGYELNGDVEAYVAVRNKNYPNLILTNIDNVPASTPVILKGSYYNKVAADLPAINAANELKGTEVDTEADGTMYVLAKVDDKVGFYKATGTIPAGKAYYQSGAGVKAFYFDGDAETAINEVNGQSSMVNGQSIYNLAGQRVSKMQKGINIVNGKKVLK